jgi:hypothetical protein
MRRAYSVSFGTFSADEVLAINLVDVLAHTWDIAVATGVGLVVEDSLWTAGLDAAHLVIGPDRDTRQYGPEVEIGPYASPKHRFLAFVGRLDPHVYFPPPLPAPQPSLRD